MGVVLDTNILISALMVQVGHPAAIYRAWQEGHFRLLTCREQLDELMATLHKPAIAARIKPYKAGRLVNDLKELAESIAPCRVSGALRIPPMIFCWPSPKRARPTTCNGRQERPAILARHAGTRIVSAGAFATLRSSGH